MELHEKPPSPYINRFLSADTIVPGYANPQALNRYSYVINNPLRYTDPTGHRFDEGNMGSHGSLNCKKYPQYCTVDGKPKSKEQLAKMRPEKKNRCETFASCNGGFSGGFDPFVPNPEEEPAFGYTDYSSSQDFYLAGYDSTINWAQVDWYHLITNASGLVSDGATALAIIGIVPAAPVAEVTFLIDAMGVSTDVIDFVADGDVTGISLDVATYVLGETKAARVIPILGFGLNLDGFLDSLYRGSTKTPIWIPKP